MPTYISAVFEKDNLLTSEQIRVIVRNVDTSSGPPVPSVSHYPTEPDDLREFIVAQYVSSVLGENFSHVAILADITGISTRQLDILQDLSVDFVAAGATAGDLIEVTLPDPQLWTSALYPGTNPFIFQIASVLSTTTVQVIQPFPAFLNNMSWEIPTLSLSSTTGITRRTGLPPNGTYFRDTRFNRLFPTVIEAENAVVSMKADLTALSNENAGAGLVTETITASPSI